MSEPAFSVVTVLYRKERELPAFFEALARQTYRGRIEVVVVDDASPDGGAAKAREAAGAHARPGLETVVLANETNLGNCLSRNVGLARATGDYVVIIDADCLMSANFLEACRKRFAQGADAVVANFGIELGRRAPKEALSLYERQPSRVRRDRKIQDERDPASFLNCVTRGLALTKAKAEPGLYDPAFSYSAAADSGFGWEDVDAGYRLSRDGARIAFAAEAFTLHMTHDCVTDPRAKFPRSLRNYRRLHEKHPELARLKRAWSLRTYGKIWLMLRFYGCAQATDDSRFLDRHLGAGPAFHGLVRLIAAARALKRALW